MPAELTVRDLTAQLRSARASWSVREDLGESDAVPVYAMGADPDAAELPTETSQVDLARILGEASPNPFLAARRAALGIRPAAAVMVIPEAGSTEVRAGGVAADRGRRAPGGRRHAAAGAGGSHDRSVARGGALADPQGDQPRGPQHGGRLAGSLGVAVDHDDAGSERLSGLLGLRRHRTRGEHGADRARRVEQAVGG